MALTTRPASVRPWLRRVAIWAFAALVPIALWTLWDYLEARRLARIVAETRARGEPTDTLSRNLDPSDPPANAAGYYMAASAVVDTTGLYGANGLLRRLDRAGADRRSLLTDVRKFLDSNAEAERLLARATQLEFDGERPGFEYTYRQSGHLTLSRLAELRTLERALSDDGNGAAAALLQRVGLTRPLGWSARGNSRDYLRWIGSIPWVGSYVARTVSSDAPEVLEAHPSDGAMEELAKGFETIDLDSIIEESVIAQRAVLLQTYWNDISDWYRNPPRDFFVSGPMFLTLRPFIIHRVNAQASLLSSLLAASRRPWPERVRVGATRVDRTTTTARSPSLLYIMDILGPDAALSEHQNYANLAARTLAIVRCARATVAIERFRRAHAGALPPSLVALVPALLPAVPVDPYSGKELHFRVESASYVVYSVSADGGDDGGGSVPMRSAYRWSASTRSAEPPDIGLRISLEPARASAGTAAVR